MRTFLLITGMHRSGTSFLARALNLSGVNLGSSRQLTHTHVNPHPTNTHGHWEHARLQELADETLALTGGTWDDIPDSVTVTPEIGQAVQVEMQKLTEPDYFAAGFKDPRSLLIFDAWKPYFPDRFVPVGIFRHPLSVAASLQKRDGFDREKGLALWQAYNERLLQIHRERGGYLLDFAWPVSRLSEELQFICKQLHLPFIGIDHWYNPGLVNEDGAGDDLLPQEIRDLYQALKEQAQLNSQYQPDIEPPDAQQLHQICRSLLQSLEQQAIFFKEVHDRDEAQALIERQQAYIRYLEDSTNIEELRQQIDALGSSLDTIHNSRTWKILRWIDRLIGKS